jgi:hypothetical protein
MAFEIDFGAFGLQKGIAMESLQSIEVIFPGSVAAAEQVIMATCPHCGKPIRVKIGK